MTIAKVRPKNVFTPLEWQYAPLNDKSPIMLLTGSAGGGKSKVAAEKYNGFCLKYDGARGLLLRKAREFATKSMVPLFRSVAGKQAVYRKSDMMFEYPNGSMVAVGGMKDEQQREAIRSIFEQGGLDWVWIEEANSLTYEDFQELRARMRGTATTWRQIGLTTNPGGPAHWIKRRLIDGGMAAVYYSSAVENPHNPADYIDTLNSLTGLQYERLVRGLWKAAEGALWDYDTIERQRTRPPSPDDLTRIVVAIDPAATNNPDSDETGIIVAGIDKQLRGYVLQDVSLHGSPATWGKAAIQAYQRWGADVIIAESNNGGDMVEHTIKTVRDDADTPIGQRVNIKQVRASRGKHTRAEPVASLYEQGRIFHAGKFHSLEDQMTSWVPGNDSPDRMDAMVWAFTELLLDKTPPQWEAFVI